MFRFRMALRPALVAAGFVVVIAAVPPKRDAARFLHTHLVKSEPAANDTVTIPPRALRLWFSDRVAVPATSVSLSGGGEASIAVAPLARPDTGQAAPIVAGLAKPLSPGTYVVTWSTVANDGHPANGSYGFVVKAPQAAENGATRKVSVKFRAMVGAEPFACGRSYSGVGTSHATITPSDFAMYVYDVSLLSADGSAVPLALDQDSVFQDGTLALLNFEDGTGPCSNGSALTHTEIVGSAPDGRYTGVRFMIGVPFERNHLELTTQPSPLSLTRMFWAWNTGHKFARFDAKTTAGKSWVLHLGSTGCTPSGGPSIVPASCAQANRVAVTFPKFDADADVIIADAAALFAGSGGTENQVCMSSPKTVACAPMFAALGLSFNGAPASPQTFLRPVPAAAVSTNGK